MKKKVELKYDFISSAKGIGIILVIIGHILLNGPIYSFSYAISIPLFFFLSGFVYKKEKYNKFSVLLKNKFNTLLIPYFIYAIVTYLYWLFIELKFNPYSGSKIMPLIQIFLAQGSTAYLPFNPPLWFIPCILITELLYFVFQNKIEKNKCWMFPVPVIGVLMILLKKYFDFSILPWSIDVACVGFMFFSIGNLLKEKHLTQFISVVKNDKSEIVSVILFFLLIIFSFINGRISMGQSVYNNFCLFLLGAFIGIYFVLFLSIKFFSNSYVLKICGDNSFVIMALHYPLKKVVSLIVSKVFDVQLSFIYISPFYSVLVTIIIIVILYYFIVFKNKFIKIKYLR